MAASRPASKREVVLIVRVQRSLNGKDCWKSASPAIEDAR